MKKYKHLFFDLDGTLWDLRKNTRVAMDILFERHAEHLSSVEFDLFYRRYHYHNDRVWALYRDNRISKEALRYERFLASFADAGFAGTDLFIRSFANDFMEECPHQPHTLEFAHQLLDHCFGKYKMHIITNGFIEVQGHKMKAAQINGYFDQIINSEHCGIRKPHAGIFQYALEKSGALKEESLMIGDDWEADILGARNFGIDQAFLTTTDELMSSLHIEAGHKPVRHNYQPTFTLQSLSELIEIL